MKCALWLNRQKVYSAEEIRGNLDIASLCGYFAAGSLVEWLKEHNGEEYAAELEKISPKDLKLSEKLEKVFGGQPVSYKTFGNGSEVKNTAPLPAGSAKIIQSSAFGSARFPALGSAPFGSGKAGARFMMHGSRGIGSFSRYTFSSGLLRIGWRSGSFGYFGSFGRYGSFGYEWEWEQFFARFGSFYSTSFSYGSARSFLQLLGRNFGSYRFGSLRARYFGSGVYFKYGSGMGSFRSMLSSRMAMPDSDEYDRILMECVFGCRLNGYGYGIHNI